MPKPTTTHNLLNTMINHFEKTHAFGQNKDRNLCRYHADNGNACAIGCLISNDDYEEWIEGRPLTNEEIGPYLSDVLRAPQTALIQFLQPIQIAHDRLAVEFTEQADHGRFKGRALYKVEASYVKRLISDLRRYRAQVPDISLEDWESLNGLPFQSSTRLPEPY